MLRVRCGGCGLWLDQPNEMAGQIVQCRHCHAEIRAPLLSSPSVPVPEEPPDKPDYSRWGILLEALLAYEKTAPSVPLPE